MIDCFTYLAIPISILIGRLSYDYFGLIGSIIAFVLLVAFGTIVHLAARQPPRREEEQNQH